MKNNSNATPARALIGPIVMFVICTLFAAALTGPAALSDMDASTAIFMAYLLGLFSGVNVAALFSYLMKEAEKLDGAADGDKE